MKLIWGLHAQFIMPTKIREERRKTFFKERKVFYFLSLITLVIKSTILNQASFSYCNLGLMTVHLSPLCFIKQKQIVISFCLNCQVILGNFLSLLQSYKVESLVGDINTFFHCVCIFTNPSCSAWNHSRLICLKMSQCTQKGLI